MKTLQRFGKSFVVTRQPTKTSHPGKAALNYPTPGKQHEAPFGFLQLDHTLRYPFLRSRLLRLRALIYVCDFDPLACTARESSPTWLRSCALAGVTRRASR